MTSQTVAHSLHELLDKRDRFAQILRAQNLSGVLSVGLTRRLGQVALLVAVREGFSPKVPDHFEDVDVVVEHFADAVAH
jgi:hypothetical protein